MERSFLYLKITIVALICSAFSNTLHSNASIKAPANKELQDFLNESEDNSIFENIQVKSKEGAAEIKWNLNYEILPLLEDKKLVIAYNTDINAKRIKSRAEGYDWIFLENISPKEVSYKLEELNGNEKYKFNLGIYSGDFQTSHGKEEVLWYKDFSFIKEFKGFKTKRPWGIMKFLILIGSLALFIFGMKIMSEGLQTAAGSRLRQMLRSITSNRLKGVLSGFGITAIVQSSSVTTVMTVSFVNAGLLKLKESAGIMMGANIGTTITGWLILLIGFKISVADYALVLMAFAGVLLFFKDAKAKAWASAIIGFCILFIGLQFLKDSVPDLDENSGLVQFFKDFKDVWYGPAMFVMLGAIVTIIIQSSSAAMALTLTMVHSGLIPFEVACAMVLGENIGTTITAEIASLIANVHAKRSARIHSLFNVIGVTWMLVLYSGGLWVIKQLVGLSTGEPFDSGNFEMAETGIALFHTCFNLANVLLLIWFIPQIVRFAERTVKSKGDEDEQFKLEFINNTIQTPSLSLLEVKREITKFGKVASKMNKFLRELLSATEKKKREKLYEKLEKYEEITDRLEIEITDFLGKVALGQLDDSMSNELQAYLSISNDLERIGDIYFQISKAIQSKNEKKHWFNQEQRDGLNEMMDLVETAFGQMLKNLTGMFAQIEIDDSLEIENEINTKRNKLRKKHLKTIGKEGYNTKAGVVYNDVFSSLEKVGDHILNVSKSMAGEV